MSEQVPIPGQFEECRDTDDSNGHDHQIAQTPCQADSKRSCEDGHAAPSSSRCPRPGLSAVTTRTSAMVATITTSSQPVVSVTAS